MSGHRCFQLLLIYHLLVNGSYKEQLKLTLCLELVYSGKLNGQHFQSLRNPVVNYFDVDARKGAGQTVGVSKLLYNITLCSCDG